MGRTVPALSNANGSPEPRRLPDLPLPSDPDLALPDIYVPPRSGLDGLESGCAGERRVRPPVGERDEDRPLPAVAVALARSVPCLLVVLVAVGGWLGAPVLPTSELPVMLVGVVAVQAAGYLIARSTELWPWTRTFLANAAIVLVILPLLAVQAATTHAPYVAPEFGTARPAIIATAAAAVGLIACACAAVATAWEAPAEAALLFLPAALLVPAMLGTEPDVDEATAVRLLVEAFAISVAATFVAVAVGGRPSALIGMAALGLYFAFLLAAGRGPTQDPSSDEIARILDGGLVATAMVLTILVPLGAIGLCRVMREVHAAERASLFERTIADER